MDTIQRKAQFTTEYLIIIGIAFGLIAIFLVYAFVYYSSYNNGAGYQQVQNAAVSITQQAQYVGSAGIGSKSIFTQYFPALDKADSFFCGDYVKVSSAGYSYLSKSDFNMQGILPTTAGSYSAYAYYTSNGSIYVGLQAGLSYVNTTYNISGSYLGYGIDFYNQIGLLAKSTSFNISVFSVGGSYLNSTIGTTPSGYASGEIYLPQNLPEYLIKIYPLGYNMFESSCFSP
ncbi:hypothetical protein M1293_00450 [Candidatus Parvarchaeota archaeon]|nr:hypothetical protein [Candidatus Parvarchaeota archaeon]